MTSESKRMLADVLEHAEVTKTIEHDWPGFNYNQPILADCTRRARQTSAKILTTRVRSEGRLIALGEQKPDGIRHNGQNRHNEQNSRMVSGVMDKTGTMNKTAGWYPA